MVKSGYGLMFHWTGQSQPRRGPQKSYREAVDAFPVSAFVEMVQETGAGHVLFTLNHALPHCPAPIRAWEKVHPGLTTERDLLGELAGALQKAGVRFMIYINSPQFGLLKQSGPGAFLPGVSAERYEDGIAQFGQVLASEPKNRPALLGRGLALIPCRACYDYIARDTLL